MKNLILTMILMAIPAMGFAEIGPTDFENGSQVANWNWQFNYVSYDDWANESDVVSFVADFDFTVTGYDVTFENLSEDAVSYSWNFGDGYTSTEENPSHTYDLEGEYTVTLTAENASGDTITAEKTVTINLDPTDAAPTPTEDAANVISIYSDAYTDIAGVNLDPDWQQETVTQEVEIDGGMLLEMADLNYQGIDWGGNPQDVSNKTKLHVDIYSDVTTDINVSVIGGGSENPVAVTTEAGAWKSFDIPLSEYTSPDLTQVIQLKFDAANSPTIYVDNMYFGEATGTNTENDNIAPSDFTLSQNFPNPFNPSTNIEYSLPAASDVTLEVFTMQGQKVATLVQGYQSAGQHTVSFNASDLASGMYTYRLTSGSTQIVKMMTLIK